MLNLHIAGLTRLSLESWFQGCFCLVEHILGHRLGLDMPAINLESMMQVYALIAVACAKLGQAVLKHSSRSEVPYVPYSLRDLSMVWCCIDYSNALASALIGTSCILANGLSCRELIRVMCWHLGLFLGVIICPC